MQLMERAKDDDPNNAKVRDDLLAKCSVCRDTAWLCDTEMHPFFCRY